MDNKSTEQSDETSIVGNIKKLHPYRPIFLTKEYCDYLDQIIAKLPKVKNQLENPWVNDFGDLNCDISILKTCGIHLQGNNGFIFVVGNIAIARYNGRVPKYYYESKDPTKTSITSQGRIRKHHLIGLLNLILEKNLESIKREEIMEILSQK